MGPLGALVLVFGLLGGLLLVVRKLAGVPSVGGGRHIKIVETTVLGPGRTVTLVQVAGRCLLLGTTSERIERLAEFAAGELPVVEEGDAESAKSRWGRLRRTTAAGT